MGGFGLPIGTTSPMPTLAIMTRLSASILFSLARRAIEGVDPMITSAVSPPSTRSVMAPMVV